jgi:hypothetical protein
MERWGKSFTWVRVSAAQVAPEQKYSLIPTTPGYLT